MWKEKAKKMYFEDKLTISQVADIVDVSRKTVGKFLSSLPEYEKEKQDRKEANKIKRKEYQREWDRKNRNTINLRVTSDTMRREHEVAVRILSSEKYH